MQFDEVLRTFSGFFEREGSGMPWLAGWLFMPARLERHRVSDGAARY
ncbi:MAG TPA: hypothetical protein VJ276_04870 [Thermoanaerobaculia bacterium]|nr:hypothetical protein [Thermoanaerobaculia bacterium]